jgi:hypothetical protein
MVFILTVKPPYRLAGKNIFSRSVGSRFFLAISIVIENHKINGYDGTQKNASGARFTLKNTLPVSQ